MPPPTLRIRAIGARNVAAKTGLAGMFEAKMNAYVVVVIGAEEKHLPVVKNVGAKEFAWGDDAVVEFAWPDASSEIKLHLKDKDTAKERYVGGAKLAFPTDITSLPVARTIDLEFSDEKLKTKKGRGQLLLSFERVGGTSDTNPTGAVQAATTAATSTATPHAPSSPAGGHVKHMLRIQAIGGGNLAPKTGLVKMLDANPDPYLVLTVAGVTKTFPALNNVKTNEFSWGDDAVHEFPVDGDAVDVIIHCKDKDAIKDHYIGGAQWRLTMADMLANPTWKQTVELDFASPDFKTKAKASQGQIHLHFVLLESGNPLTRPTEPPTVLASAEVQAVSPTNSGPDTKGMPGTADTIVKAEEGIPSPTKPATTSETILQPGEAPSPQDIRDGVLSATQSSPKPEQSPAPHLLHVEKVQRMLRVQAIGGANLAPKTGLEHLMDANPDPYLVLTVAGVTKTFPELNNVKTNEFSWGDDAVHEFPVDGDAVDVIIHCKDMDTIKDRYIGGAKLSIRMADIMAATPSWKQTVELEFATPDLTTKAKESRGTIYLGFTLTDSTNATSQPPGQQRVSTEIETKHSSIPSEPKDGTVPAPAASVPQRVDVPREVAPQAAAAAETSEPSNPAMPAPDSSATKLPPTLPLGANFKRTLRVQAVGGRNLAPKTGLNHIVDCEPDPYLIVIVGSTTKLYPVVDNVKTKEFAWGGDAVHEFVVPATDDSIELSIHCKDKDILVDHYIGGARVVLPVASFGRSKTLENQTVCLDYVDASFQTKAPHGRGVLILSYFLVETPLPNSAVPPIRTLSPRKTSLSARLYKGTLRLIAHSAKHLTLPPHSRVPGVPDKHADPYVVFQVGPDRIACPEAINGHFTPTWSDAKHTFQIDTSQHAFVEIAIFDKKRDRFMAATRLRLVDVVATLTNHIQATVVVKLDCDQTFRPVDGASGGDLQLSLLFTPWNPNQVTCSSCIDLKLSHWTTTGKGAAVGHIQISSLSLSNYADVVPAHNQVYLEISVRRHASAIQGHLSFQTKTIESNKSPLTWPDDVLWIPYALFLHPNMTKDKCPVVVFALHDKHAIARDKPLVQNSISLVDVLGWNGSKQVPLLHSKLPGRPTLAFSAATTAATTATQLGRRPTAPGCHATFTVPLASFVVATPACSLFSTKLTLERNGQPTGTILIAGIYESKTAPEAIRNSCHSHGQKLRLATPSLSTFVDSSYCPGRLDIHVAMAKDLNQNPHVPYRCELCLSSCVDSRMSLQSRQPDSMATTTDIVWDYQLTLYTQTAKADFLRLDLFQGCVLRAVDCPDLVRSRPALVGWAKVPLSTYCQEPTKSFREYHDVVLTARDTTAIIKPRIMLELTFFTDQTLQTFVDQTALASPTAGVLYVTLDTFDSRHTAQLAKKKLSLRVTLLHVTATDGDPDASKQVAMFPFQVLSDATLSWHRTVALVCPADLTRQTTSKGTCPLLRYELIDGSSGASPLHVGRGKTRQSLPLAFGKDAISRDEMAIQSLLLAPKAVITKRLPNSTIATDREPLGFSKLRLVYVPQGAPSSLPQRDANDDRFHEQFTDVIQPNRGTLSIRVISGRNLADVDVLGEQDPYVQLQLDPPTYQLMPGCVVSAQSGVCVNGGRHPQWNSPVYNLSIHDSNVEIVTIRVLDSGEEDNVPDAMIGACHLSVYSLIQMSGQDGKHQQRWSEGWFNLFHDQEPAGELRLEYRFVPDNATRVCMEPPTKYINCLGGRGKMAVKVLSGTNLPCVSGMVPAVRVFVESTKFSYVTQPEKRHIVHPTWNETVLFDMEWTPELTSARTIRMELVDLVSGAGVASQLPILAHCTIHAAAFVVHPLETHYGTYPLTTFQLQKGQSNLADVPSLHLAIQFLPFDTTVQPFDDPFVAPEPGQIHVNVTSAAFRTNDAFRPLVRCTLRHDAVSQTKATPPCVSDLDDYSFCEWKAPLLFDFTMPDRDSHHILPSLHFQVLCHSDNADDAPVLGELDNVPLFPFVMHKGHVDVVWYPVYSKSAAVVAQVKVEVQFLKTSPVPKTTFTDVLTVQVVEGRAVWSAQDTTIDATDAQDPFVELDFLGHHVQAHIDGGTDPAWHETFELPLLGLDSTVLPVLTVSVRNQDVKRKGDGTIGASRFVVPKEVLYDGKLRDVWLPLSSDAAGAATDTELGKIHLRLKRGQLDKSGFVDAVSVTSAGEDTKESPNLAGVLYTYGSKPWEVRAAFQRPDATLPAYTAFRLVEMGVLPVPWQDEPLKRNLPHNDLTFLVESPKTNQCIALGPDDVRAILHTPRREFHYTSNESKASAGHGNEASPSFEISVVYMPPTQGLVQISIDQVDGIPVVHGTSYFVEFRVLRNSPWVKSPSVRAKVEDKTDQTIAWQPHAVREMQYSNFREHTPPLLQVVLYAQSKATSTRTKVGFGQLNLLQYIAMPAKYVNEVVPITCVGRNHNRSDDKATATVAIEFVPGVATSPDDAEAKALQLAQGTAAMKKAFLSLGGDECTPLDIDRLKEAAATDSASMHMLQSAAKLVGGLDALFAAMDTNKDGKISWEEYLDRMQFVHALADEASTKPANLQPSNPLDVEELENDTDEDDDSKVDKDEPAQSKNASGALSSPPWKPPKSPSRIHYSDYSDDDDDGIDDAPSIMAASKGPSIHSNPAIAPMVALSVDDAVKASSVSRVTLAAAPRKPQQQGPDESAVASWKVADVSAWLEVDVELPQYIPAFMDASVDGHLLLSLTPDDMDQHFQIQQPLHRRKLLAREKFSAASAVNRSQDTKGGESAVNDPEEEPRSTRGAVVRKPNDRPPQGPRPPVDLNAKGHHEIERSKLAYKAQSKKKTQRRDQREVDEATKRWTFEYTGAAKPKRVQTAIEKVAAVMAKDEQTRSGYEGAMEQVLEQVAPPRLEMPLVANTDEIIEVLKQAIWRHAEALEVAAEHQAALDKDAASDFGDDEDEKKEDMAHPVSGLERVFADLCALKNNGARWLHDTAKLSRLKFEGGLMALLGIHMSWHQFGSVWLGTDILVDAVQRALDLVFRRLDAANTGEISWSAFSAAFGDPIPGNAMSNDMLAVKEGLVLMIERLEEHDLTLHQAWQIYLMMAALDTSCDRLIQYPEFVKFIYIVWSHRLLQLQEYLSHEDATATHNQDIVKRKVKLRKALRTNFSRPFRDAMRCSPVTIPGPFHGLLEKFHLQPPSVDGHMQIWQVLKGETSHRDKAPAAMAPKPDKPKKGTAIKLLAQVIAYSRDKCVLRAPVPVDLDDYQELIYDLNFATKMDDDDIFRERIDPKLDMNSTEFSAKDYLATKHAYSALVADLQSLKRSTSDKTEQLKALVASHFDEYLSCHEAIREVAEEIRAHQADSELLTAAYQKLKNSTDVTLSLMLQRCEEQRKIQHAMAVFHRFRPMLEVPARLRSHLQQRDFLKREAIQALEWLQLVPKPALICVKHQLAAVEKQLLLCATGPPTDAPGGKPLGIITTFGQSVWGLVCDTMKAAALTAAEQEALHTSVVVVLTSTVKHLEDHLVGLCTTPEFTASIHSLFVQFDSLKPCPDSVLNAKVAALKQRCCVQLRQDGLLACLAAQTQRTENEWLAYPVQNEWTNAMDALAKRTPVDFTCSTTNKGALTGAAFAWHNLVQPSSSKRSNNDMKVAKWWQSVHPVLTASTETNTSPSDEAHRTVFCPALYDGAASGITALVAVFADTLHGMVESVPASTIRGTSGPGHAPLVALANAVELDGLLSPLLFKWFALHPKHIHEILQPVGAMKEEFFQAFLAPRLEALDTALEAEEVAEAPSTSVADDDNDTGHHGDESRQYFFSVLLLLVTWRHDVERSIPEPAYVDSMLKQCVAKIATYLEGRIRNEVAASSWCLTHLHVELSFVCTHFKRWLPPTSVESTVLKSLQTKRDVVQALASQLDLQTQMYRLCLSS
ncbi:hypothetical protein DYB32_004650 [Aphanomyces invadans]|uniref:Uncharacterized protein n=1 Tax=Aphanomyces invadans TaxID=157072 RepID=A0A418AWW6_9STRA|nr:hypothetical protein DYB32_004650 [Aphanomyces invadans]